MKMNKTLVAIALVLSVAITAAIAIPKYYVDNNGVIHSQGMDITSGSVNATNINVTNIKSTSIDNTGTANITKAAVNDFSAANLVASNARISGGTGNFTNSTIVNATIVNTSATNITSTNITSTTISVTDVSAGNLNVTSSSSTLPSGVIQMYGGANAPSGWAICDGHDEDNVGQAGLYAVIGTSFGAGTNAGKYKVPDFRRRVPMGSGGTNASNINTTIGSTGGSETITLTIEQMPAHTHDYVSGGAGGPGDNAITTNVGGENGITVSTGGGNYHSITQPSLVVNYIIKY